MGGGDVFGRVRFLLRAATSVIHALARLVRSRGRDKSSVVVRQTRGQSAPRKVKGELALRSALGGRHRNAVGLVAGEQRQGTRPSAVLRYLGPRPGA